MFNLEKGQIPKYQNTIFQYAKEHYPDLVKEIAEKKDLTPEIEKQLDKLLSEFVGMLEREAGIEVEEAEVATEEAKKK